MGGSSGAAWGGDCMERLSGSTALVGWASAPRIARWTAYVVRLSRSAAWTDCVVWLSRSAKRVGCVVRLGGSPALARLGGPAQQNDRMDRSPHRLSQTGPAARLRGPISPICRPDPLGGHTRPASAPMQRAHPPGERTHPAVPVGSRAAGRVHVPARATVGEGWRGERGGRGAPRVRLAGAGAGARDPRPRGALGRDAAADGVAGVNRRVLRDMSGADTPAWTALPPMTIGAETGGKLGPSGSRTLPLFNTTRCGPRTFPRPGVCSRSPSGPAGGYRPAGAGAPDPVPHLGGAVMRSG